LSLALGDYIKAKECLEKALAIATEISDRQGKPYFQLQLGALSLGIKYADANKCFRGALLIATEIGDRNCETGCYKHLGNLFQRLDDDVKAKEHYEGVLAVSK